MEYFIFSIYDRVAGLYAAPFLQVNAAAAKRYFRSVIEKDNSADPLDYELFCLGSFDTVKGEIVSHSPNILCKGGDLFETEK